MTDLERVSVFCDGSCLGNPGPGGWAALLVVVRDGKRSEKLVVGGAKATTNNRMELQAATSGLAALKRKCAVTVVTDSNYVVQGMSSWRFAWVRKGWRKGDGKPVENRDLWEALIAEGDRHETKWQWVRGHSGHPENELVDKAAVAESYRVRDGGGGGGG